jgi:hypothetical protein
MPNHRLPWLLLGVSTVACVLFLTSCSDSDSDDENGSAAVQTPDGQATLSLDGKLPAGWPDDFPLPESTAPEGSGSLVNEDRSAMIGVYDVTSLEPTEVADFYRNEPSVEATGATAVVVGNDGIGAFDMIQPVQAHVRILPNGDGSRLVVTLRQS